MASVIAAMVFGGLATFGLRIVVVAFQVDAAGLWVWGLLCISLLLLWAVIHVLWNAFGISLIISAGGIRKPGPFRGLRLPAEDLQIGRYDTTRTNFGTSGASTALRSFKTTEFWALAPGKRATLIWDGPRDAPQIARIEMAIAQTLCIPVQSMSIGGTSGFPSGQ
ncbi:hypothetical protein A8B78_07085 [Jannaschia sp. EhC01]|nr:hypothetical protein A8B78_07085 [Jannaschia sp. EhC01]